MRALLLNFLFGLSAMCCLSGCGYQISQSELECTSSTVSIPYVEGDRDGFVTAALIRELASSGRWIYIPDGGDLILKVKLLDFRDENIGFRYDRNSLGEIVIDVVPAEVRLSVLAEIQVWDAVNGCQIIEPVRVSASIDLDHDYYSGGAEVFSLGQFTDRNEAVETARRPLNQALAQKIVDYLTNTW